MDAIHRLRNPSLPSPALMRSRRDWKQRSCRRHGQSLDPNRRHVNRGIRRFKVRHCHTSRDGKQKNIRTLRKIKAQRASALTFPMAKVHGIPACAKIDQFTVSHSGRHLTMNSTHVGMNRNWGIGSGHHLHVDLCLPTKLEDLPNLSSKNTFPWLWQRPSPQSDLGPSASAQPPPAALPEVNGRFLISFHANASSLCPWIR